MMYGGNARSGPNYLVRNGAVAVPADYVGLHFRAWPLFNAAHWAADPQPYPTQAAPAPTIGFGSVRMIDACGYALWDQLEPSAGVYDWTYMDTMVTTYRTGGRSVNYSLWGTPTFYLSAGNPALSNGLRYKAYPDSTSPNGLTGLSNFITALVTRYNTANGGWATQTNGAGTNWSVLGKGIQSLEPNNEPQYGAECSKGQLVDMCYTIKNAAKAVDPSIVMGSPGFVGVNNVQTFIQATGTINTGVTGLSVCETIRIHWYNTSPPGFGLGTYTPDIVANDANLRTVLAAIGAGGLPIEMAEGGFDFNYPSSEMTLVSAQSAQWRYNWWGRLLLFGAAKGYQKWVGYGWDTPYLNYPWNDPNGTAKAINDVHVNVAGKTILDAYYDFGGPVTLRFTDGASFAI